MKRVIGGILTLILISAGVWYGLHRYGAPTVLSSWETCKARILEEGMMVTEEDDADVDGLPVRTLIAHDGTSVVAGVFEGDGHDCQPLAVKNGTWTGDEAYDPEIAPFDARGSGSAKELLVKVFPFESSIIIYKDDDALQVTKFIDEYAIFNHFDSKLREHETYGTANYFGGADYRTHSITLCLQGNEACLEGSDDARDGFFTFMTTWDGAHWTIVDEARHK